MIQTSCSVLLLDSMCCSTYCTFNKYNDALMGVWDKDLFLFICSSHVQWVPSKEFHTCSNNITLCSSLSSIIQSTAPPQFSKIFFTLWSFSRWLMSWWEAELLRSFNIFHTCIFELQNVPIFGVYIWIINLLKMIQDYLVDHGSLYLWDL
jgi:hypothetical protein